MLLTDVSLDHVLHPASQFMHDWMHGLFSSGAFNVLMHCFFERLEAAGVDPYGLLRDYIQKWHMPNRLQQKFDAAKVFEKSRRKGNRENTKFRCSASDGLTLFPLLAFWVKTFCIPAGIAVRACEVFVAFCQVAELFTTIARGVVTPDQLSEAVEKFLDMFVGEFGTDPWISKFHWLLHYPRELRQHGTLYACWVHERKHKQIRRYACAATNTRTYERTVLEEITCQQIFELKQPNVLSTRAGLIEPTRTLGKHKAKILLDAMQLPNTSKVRVAMCSRCNALSCCTKGDVVLISNGHDKVGAGKVLLNLEVEDVPITLIRPFKVKAFFAVTGSADCDTIGGVQVYATDDFLCTVQWMQIDATGVRLLIPWHLRKKCLV